MPHSLGSPWRRHGRSSGVGSKQHDGPQHLPFFAVCSDLIHVKDVDINIEGDPRTNKRGTLCPKGAPSISSPDRISHQISHRNRRQNWERLAGGAMDRVAELVKKTREETFIERLPNGTAVNMTPAIFALGGATLDNEFNHICQKFNRGLGIVAIENQARI